MFAGWPSSVGSILSSRFAGESHEIHVRDHDPIDVWHRDNVLLIGDAAHAALPTSGQGACQALEDAWFLANTLEEATSGTPIEESLSQFTSLRTDKTKQICVGARNLAQSLFETESVKCQYRDAQARSANYKALAKGMAQLWWTGLPTE